MTTESQIAGDGEDIKEPEKRVALIGTGHVFDIGAAVQGAIYEEEPKAVCIELDRGRLQALLDREAGIEQDLSKQPKAYRFLASIQESIAESYGTDVGGEMVAAVNAAKAIGVPLVCIDVDARIAFQKVVKTMTFKEKAKLLTSSLWGVIAGAFRKGRMEEEIAHYSKNPEIYLKKLGEAYPSITRILIDERNERMISNIMRVLNDVENVAVVVGDGHVPGMEKLLREKGVKVRTVRMAELRKLSARCKDNGNINKKTHTGMNASLSGDGIRASVSYNISFEKKQE